MRRAAQIARDVSEACSYFALHQMPELFAGLQRNGASFPVQYLGANVPQAWAAGSVFAFLQSVIGFQPHGDVGILYLDPWLPRWLPDLTLRDLRVGQETFDLRIHGRGPGRAHRRAKGRCHKGPATLVCDRKRAARCSRARSGLISATGSIGLIRPFRTSTQTALTNNAQSTAQAFRLPATVRVRVSPSERGQGLVASSTSMRATQVVVRPQSIIAAPENGRFQRTDRRRSDEGL
jgi:hypothetical protein